MKLGAVLIAAGKNANPLLSSGEITVAQRMIATLQKTGVIRITVVTGPSDKKMEKQLAQYGVFFLQNPQPENQGTSISLGIHSLADKCDWIFFDGCRLSPCRSGYSGGYVSICGKYGTTLLWRTERTAAAHKEQLRPPGLYCVRYGSDGCVAWFCFPACGRYRGDSACY